MEMEDIDATIKIEVDRYLGRIMPESYMQHIIAPVQINNGKGKLPDDIECIIMVVGDDNVERCEKPYWRKELVGVMQKASDGCTYTVFADCDECDEPDCDNPIILAAKEAQHMIDKGSKYLLTRHSLGYGRDEKDGRLYGPYGKQWSLMAPNVSSAFFDERHMDGCIGLGMSKYIGEEYHYTCWNGVISTGFKKGRVLVSYLGYLRSSDGIKQVPYDDFVINELKLMVRHKVYDFLSLKKKTPKYERAAINTKRALLEVEGQARAVMSHIDYAEYVSILEEFQGWNKDKDFINFMANCPDWLMIYQNEVDYEI